MSDLNVPNVFVSGTSIVAADMNANFDAIETMINTTGVPRVQNGAVSTSQLGIPAIGLVQTPSTSVASGDGTKVLNGAGTLGFETQSSIVDVDAATSRNTAGLSGYYRVRIAAAAHMPASATMSAGVRQYNSGGSTVDTRGLVTRSNPTASLWSYGFAGEFSYVLLMSAGDYVQAYATNNSATSTNVVVDLWLEYIGASS